MRNYDKKNEMRNGNGILKISRECEREDEELQKDN
jgi:hypothetical protein